MKNVFQVVKDYEAYIAEGNADDLSLFAEWLKQKHSTTPKDYMSKEETVNAVGSGIIASYMLGGMSSYFEMWTKLSFKDIPISGIMDFGILKQVEKRGNPTKKEVISEAIAERTSCVEAMKRLVKRGILKESTDKRDKRMRRVELTEEGHKLIQVIDGKMMNMGRLLMGNLNETEMKSLIPPLKKLMSFHENLNRTREKEDIKKAYGI